jgi:branched-chain amino acid transport system substrate-binding protein
MSQWLIRHKWLWLAAAVMISLLAFAACEDDEEKPAGQTPAAGETPADETPAAVAKICEGGPGVKAIGGGDGLVSSSPGLGTSAAPDLGAAEPLKIGVLVPSTGALSTFGPDYINAARLAAKCLNNFGGVNGAEVQLSEADTGTNPEQGVAEADRLVNVENVVAILGAAASGVSLAVAESVTVPNGILQISPASTSVALTTVQDNDLLFRMPISDDGQAIVLSNLIKEDLGLTSVCALYVNNAYGQGFSAKLKEVFEAAGGTVTASVPHDDAAAVSYLGQINECLEGDPEALVAISYPTGQAKVYLKEAIENDLINNFVFVDGTKEPTIFSELGWETFDGMKGTAPGVLTTDSGRVFDAAYEAEYGTIFQTPFVREAFDAVFAIGLAAAKAGTNTDSAAIRDALREIGNAPGTQFADPETDLEDALTAAHAGEDIDWVGASGGVEWNENGDVNYGGIEVWRVDAATETLVTEQIYAVDLVAGTVEPAE